MDQKKLNELAAKAEQAKFEKLKARRAEMGNSPMSKAPYASIEFDRTAAGKPAQSQQTAQGKGSEMVKNTANKHNMNPPGPMRSQPDRDAHYENLRKDICNAKKDSGNMKNGQDKGHDKD